MIIYFKEMWQLVVNGETQGIWFWCALYVLISCVYSLTYQIRIRRWPATRGELVTLKIERFGATAWAKSKQEYASEALYNYSVAGKSYEGVRISPWIFVVNHNVKAILATQLKSVRRYPSGSVKVFYDQKNPKKSFLVLPGKIGVAVTAVLSALPMLLFWLKYHQ